MKLSLFVLVAFLSSCGFKTEPTSDVIEHKPEIPFRKADAEEEKKDVEPKKL